MVTNKFRDLALIIVAFAMVFAACASEGEETATEEPDTSSAPPAVTAAPETSAPPTESANPLLTAELSELQGLVEMKQAEESEFSLAQLDSTLDVDGQIQTGDNGKVRLDLSSGTIVRVSPSSLFTLVSNEEGEDGLVTRLKLGLGQIFIILNGGSLEIETPSGVASVLGSYLMGKVTMSESGSEVETITFTCLEGDCTYVTESGKTIKIPQDHKIVISKDPDTGEWVLVEGEMTPEDYLEWLESPEAQALIDAAMGSSGGGGGGGGGGGCSELLGPADGSTEEGIGTVEFKWTSLDDADRYVITFTSEDGDKIYVHASDANKTLDIGEVLSPGGTYSWNVTAFDENGEICTSESQVFTKPDTETVKNDLGSKNEEDEKSKKPKPTEPPATVEPQL